MPINNSIRTALEFAERGWAVFPLAPRSKVPLLAEVNWQDTSTLDPDQIATWGKEYPECNFGVDLGKAMLTVVDIDNSGTKKGTQNFNDYLDDQLEDLQATFTVSTPTGGYHHYYSTPTRNYKLVKDVDIKSAGGYVVIPGSIHPDGGQYEVITPGECEAIPLWLFESIGEQHTREDDAAVPLIDEDQSAHIIEALSYLNEEAEGAVEGANGHDHTYQVACQVRDFGISQSTTLGLMINSGWNERCSPSWDLFELEKVVGNAFRYAINPAGTATQEGKSVQAAEIFKAAGSDWEGPKPLSYFKGTPKPREWIIKGLVPYGIACPSLMTGEGGTGKSLVAIQMGMSVAGGIDWMGHEVLKRMKVLIVLCEDSDDEFHLRKHDIMQRPEYAMAEDLIEENLSIWSRVGKDNVLGIQGQNSVVTMGAYFADLDRALVEMGEGPKFLILDTVADIFAGNENDRTAVNQFVKHILVSICKKHNATLLVLGHPPKAEGQTYSGSTAWNNAFRNRLFMARHEKETLADLYRTVCVAKSNYAVSGLSTAFYVKWEAGVYIAVDETEIVDDKELESKENLRLAIEEHDAAGARLGLNHNSAVWLKTVRVRDHLGKLMDWDTKKILVGLLIREGVVEEIKGEPRNNGLAVTSFTDIDFEEVIG